MNEEPFVLPNDLLFEEVESRIARGESVTIPFAGHSMHPALRHRQVNIELSPITRPLRKHDVVLFRSPYGHILHRIVSMDEHSVVTRGDACLSSETSLLTDVVALLTAVQWPSGRRILCNSFRWYCRSSFSVLSGRLCTWMVSHFDRTMRRRFSVVYFIILLALMWLPLGFLGVPLNNFVFGIRLDHLIHASVYLPCAFFLMDSRFRGVAIWLLALLIATTTEFGQLLLPYRGFDINDLVANWLGVTLGWLPLRRFRRRKSL